MRAIEDIPSPPNGFTALTRGGHRLSAHVGWGGFRISGQRAHAPSCPLTLTLSPKR